MTIQDAVREGTRVLEKVSLPEAAYDARALALFLRKWSYTDYALRRKENADDAFLRTYQELIARRAERIPLQYITGTAPFFGRDFYVTPDVLIPRFDTETLVEAALKAMDEKKGKEMDVLDLCTGSGCIPISLALQFPERAHYSGTDISLKALAVARHNAEHLHAKVNFYPGDLFAEVRGEYDIITANPPYIQSDVIKTLDPEVRDHEPHLALDGGADGLAFYRRIVKEAPLYLKTHGLLMMEIGADQGAEVVRLAQKAGFSSVRIEQDLAGHDRVAAARK